MDSKIFAIFCLTFSLAACSWFSDDSKPYADDEEIPITYVATPMNDQGYADDANVSYWVPMHVTADNVQDPVRAQNSLEEDLAECGYETQERVRWINDNDPVTDSNGDVVDKRGIGRVATPLPNSYRLTTCMRGKGWSRLKHYYTIPY